MDLHLKGLVFIYVEIDLRFHGLTEGFTDVVILETEKELSDGVLTEKTGGREAGQ